MLVRETNGFGRSLPHRFFLFKEPGTGLRPTAVSSGEIVFRNAAPKRPAAGGLVHVIGLEAGFVVTSGVLLLIVGSVMVVLSV